MSAFSLSSALVERIRIDFLELFLQIAAVTLNYILLHIVNYVCVQARLIQANCKKEWKILSTYPKVFTQSWVDYGVDEGVCSGEPVTAKGQKDVDGSTVDWVVDGIHELGSVVDDHVCEKGQRF